MTGDTEVVWLEKNPKIWCVEWISRSKNNSLVTSVYKYKEASITLCLRLELNWLYGNGREQCKGKNPRVKNVELCSSVWSEELAYIRECYSGRFMCEILISQSLETTAEKSSVHISEAEHFWVNV